MESIAIRCAFRFVALRGFAHPARRTLRKVTALPALKSRKVHAAYNLNIVAAIGACASRNEPHVRLALRAIAVALASFTQPRFP
ncbi:MAG: hypothetical protein KGI87_10775 [Burkholderiales bacterium]|nr:hypothetical protein [Burkholderiales bacterium]